MSIGSRIITLIQEGQLQEAIEEIDLLLATTAPTEELYRLRGNAYYKLGNWKEAIQSFEEAVALDEDSPAAELLQMAQDIMNYFNRDLYNP